jgi:predicted RNA-binding Zn ribbon-like protein
MTSVASRPAPGRLALIQDLVNTRDIEAGTDALRRPADLAAWLARHGLPTGGRLSARDLAFAIELREALRSLLVANAAGEPPAPAAVAVLNVAADRCDLVPRLDRHGASVITAQARGVCAPVGALLAAMHEANASGEWIRLKACLEDSCHWAFYDTSRNHSSRWCSMGVCGNRRKNRAYYARRRDAAG